MTVFAFHHFALATPVVRITDAWWRFDTTDIPWHLELLRLVVHQLRLPVVKSTHSSFVAFSAVFARNLPLMFHVTAWHAAHASHATHSSLVLILLH